MKTQLSLTELAQQIEARKARKEDFVADTRQLTMKPDATLAMGSREFKVNDHAHGQIADRLAIPTRYYDRMRSEQPALLASNVNTWFNEKPEPRMLRTIDGTARAFLSDKYSRLDDEHFAETVLPVVMDVPGAEVVSCAITDTKTHIKFVSRKMLRDVKAGDTIAFGIAFSNSEVGAGAIAAHLFTERLICTNGMISAEDVFRSTHVGAKHRGRDLTEILQLDTIQADGKATMLKLRDFARDLLSDRVMDEHIGKLQALAGVQVKDPVKTIEKLGKAHGFGEGERNSVLEHLIRGGDLSLFGLAQAVTRTAEDLPDYNRSTDFERIGGKMLDLTPAEYREMALAA